VSARSRLLSAVVALITCACTGGSHPGATPKATLATGSPIPSAPLSPTLPPQGGSVVFGAERWPECLNPITSCAEPWTYYSVLQHVLPRAMQLDPEGNFVASPLLVEAPSLANGDLGESPFTVTFRIDPNAVWDDGSRITSGDFDFTWRAIMNTTGASSRAGYDQIDSIYAVFPDAAIIRFKSVYLDWPDLFGGAWGFILKRSAFPEFSTSDKPDLRREMAEDIPFSGGSFRLKSWSKKRAVLVRNDNYFGSQANLDQVTFIPVEGLDPEAEYLNIGRVAAIYPQPSDRSPDTGPGNQAVKAIGGNGTYVEALWFNNSKPPLDDAAVREALMYAIDRQSVIDTIIKLNNPNAEVLNCGFLALPNVGLWCGAKPFEQFTYDPEKSKVILEGHGYNCSATPCTKDGKPLQILYSDTATNLRQTSTQELLIPKALDAGFELKVVNYDAGVILPIDVGPRGSFTMADYAQGGSSDPSVTSLLACDSIPTAKNAYSGGNWIRWCDRDATALMQASDEELEPVKRLDDMNQIYALEAQDFISLPLYVIPAVSAWRTDKIAGPVGTYNSSFYGLFFNMNEWYAVAP
jgi:peptide/nickel transport system substrate-binding protein